MRNYVNYYIQEKLKVNIKRWQQINFQEFCFNGLKASPGIGHRNFLLFSATYFKLGIDSEYIPKKDPPTVMFNLLIPIY